MGWRAYPLAELAKALEHLDRVAFGKLIVTTD
jgi:hypothetical protein